MENSPPGIHTMPSGAGPGGWAVLAIVEVKAVVASGLSDPWADIEQQTVIASSATRPTFRTKILINFWK